MEIIVYITDERERILGGNPLALHMRDDDGRQRYLTALAEALEADVIRMPGGDHMVVKR